MPSLRALRGFLFDSLVRLLGGPQPDASYLESLRSIARLTGDSAVDEGLGALLSSACRLPESNAIDSLVESRLAIARLLLEESGPRTPWSSSDGSTETSPDHVRSLGNEEGATSLGRVIAVLDAAGEAISASPSVETALVNDSGSACMAGHLVRRCRLARTARQFPEALLEISTHLLSGESPCEFIDGLYGLYIMPSPIPDSESVVSRVVERCASPTLPGPLHAIPRDLCRLIRKDASAGGTLARRLSDASGDLGKIGNSGPLLERLLRAAGDPAEEPAGTAERSTLHISSWDRDEALIRGVEVRLASDEGEVVSRAFLEAYRGLLDSGAGGSIERLATAAAFLSASSSARALSYLFELRALAGVASDAGGVVHPGPVAETIEKAILDSSGLEACFARSARRQIPGVESATESPGDDTRRRDDIGARIPGALLARALAGDVRSAQELLRSLPLSGSNDQPARTARMLLASSHPAVRRMGASLLVSDSPDRALAHAVYLIESNRPAHQIAGVSLLELYDLQTARPLLLQLLKSGDPWVVHSAVRAAGSLGRASQDEELAGAVLAARRRCAGGSDTCASAVIAIGAPRAVADLAGLHLYTGIGRSHLSGAASP